nr:sodium/proton-translocating pyrophosphatase [Enterocloster clostridioformis]
MEQMLFLVPVVGLLGLLFAVILRQQVVKDDPGTDKMREIADAIAEGANAFLASEYRILVVFVAVLFFVIGFGTRLFIGGMLTFLFSAMTMESVSKAAHQMIEEVRRQFRENPGILKGTDRPDYASCVSISTKAALREMFLPGLMAVLAPLATGLILGPSALGGLLTGALVTGVLMAIFMSNSGGAWDNAKKYIEEGNHGGKGSDSHKAAVVGDTVGDPFKDTSGPSINILIKLMTIVSLVFAPLFLQFGGLI